MFPGQGLLFRISTYVRDFPLRLYYTTKRVRHGCYRFVHPTSLFFLFELHFWRSTVQETKHEYIRQEANLNFQSRSRVYSLRREMSLTAPEP